MSLKRGKTTLVVVRCGKKTKKCAKPARYFSDDSGDDDKADNALCPYFHDQNSVRMSTKGWIFRFQMSQMGSVRVPVSTATMMGCPLLPCMPVLSI